MDRPLLNLHTDVPKSPIRHAVLRLYIIIMNNNFFNE